MTDFSAPKISANCGWLVRRADLLFKLDDHVVGGVDAVGEPQEVIAGRFFVPQAVVGVGDVFVEGVDVELIAAIACDVPLHHVN